MEGAATRKRPTSEAAGELGSGIEISSSKSMGIVRSKIKEAGLPWTKGNPSPRFRLSEKEHWMAKVGDKVPSATLRMLGPEGPKAITTEELFAPGKTVVAFALPGAFTPT
jgi:hypothetical protein